METKQKSDWCITCKFWAFAQSYTGLRDCGQAIEELSDGDQIWDCREKDFVTVETLNSIWDEYVEIRLSSSSPAFYGRHCLSLNIYAFSHEYNWECDCVSVKKLLHSIIKNLK